MGMQTKAWGVRCVQRMYTQSTQLYVDCLTSAPSHILPSASHTFGFLGLLEQVTLILNYLPELKELTVSISFLFLK